MTIESHCDADELAQHLVSTLGEVGITVPEVDLTGSSYQFDPTDQTGNPLYENPANISIGDVTDTAIDGVGSFDKMMTALNAHIERQYKANRITGAEYAEVYSKALSSTLETATRFAMGKDQAKFEAIRTQMDARKSQIDATVALANLDRAKFETASTYYQMKTSAADNALKKMQVAIADQEYCLAKAGAESERFKVDKLLPVSLAQENHKLRCLMPAQTRLVEEQLEAERGKTLDYRSDGITPIQGILGRQREIAVLEVSTREYNLTNMLPTQLDLVREQRESERAKTMDTRTDLTTVTGSVGKQKDLYTQQIDSFQKDAKHKAAKMYLDGWITQKTLDEGLLAPTELQNETVDTVLESVRLANGLV